MEDEEYKKLPCEEKCIHKLWKARVCGYEEVTKLFRQIDDDKSAEFGKYLGLVKKFVTDSNAMGQEKGLEATLAYVENYAHAGKTVSEVMSGIVTKCIAAPRTKTRELALQVTLMYIEIEKFEAVQEELMKGTEQKNPKIVAACIQALTTALREFGIKIITPKPIIKKIGILFSDRDKSVRDEARLLVIELYKWMGPNLKNHLQAANLQPVQITELETEFAKMEGQKAIPIRYIRSQQQKQAKLAASIEETNEDEDEGDNYEAPQDIDPYDLADPVDILSKLPKDFYEKIEAKKWQERKEALESLETLLKHPKLENGDYGDLVRALKKVIQKDSNVICVALAGKCVAGLATSLKKRFQTYSGVLVLPLLEKFKEKKQNVVTAIREAIDATYLTTNLEAILEDVLESLNNKNPSVKSETSLFLARAFTKTQPSAVNKKLLKAITGALTKNVQESDSSVRETSAEALGTLMKLVGEKAIGPFLMELEKDNLKMSKIREFSEKAEITVKIVGPKKTRPQTAPSKVAASREAGDGGSAPKPVKKIITVYESMSKQTEKVKPSSKNTIVAALDKPVKKIITGYESMSKQTEKVKPSSKNTIVAALDKARPNLPLKPLPKKAPPIEEKTVRGTKPVANKQNAVKPKAASAPAKAVPPISGRKKDDDIDTSPLLVVNNLKHQRTIDESRLKVLKWNFTQPREEFVDLLKDQMTAANVNRMLMANMFHSDFRLPSTIAPEVPKREVQGPFKLESEFMNDLDKITPNFQKLPIQTIDTEFLKEEVKMPSFYDNKAKIMPLSPPKPVLANKYSDLQGLPSVDPKIIKVIKLIGIQNLAMGLQGLTQFIELMNSPTKVQAFTDFEEDFVNSIVSLLKYLHTLDPINDPTVARIYRDLFKSIDIFYQKPQLGKKVPVVSLKNFINELIFLLVEEKLEKCGDVNVRIIKVNCVKIIEESDHTAVLRALVKLITECITNDNCPDRHVDMVMKCLWKVIKLMPTWGENVDYESVLLEVHHFLVKFPSKWWTKRPVDTPMRTIKTILHSTVKIKGANSMQLLRKIPNPAESEIESYILRVLKSLKIAQSQDVSLQPQRSSLSRANHNMLTDISRLKVLKWNFTQPREEFVDLLKDQMTAANVNRMLMANMFHSDFRLPSTIAPEVPKREVQGPFKLESEFMNDLDKITPNFQKLPIQTIDTEFLKEEVKMPSFYDNKAKIMPLSPPKPVLANKYSDLQGLPSVDPKIIKVIKLIGIQNLAMGLQGLTQFIELMNSPTKVQAFTDFEEDFVNSIVSLLKYLHTLDPINDPTVARIYRDLFKSIDIFYQKPQLGKKVPVVSLKNFINELIFLLVEEKLEKCGDVNVRIIKVNCVKIIEESDHTAVLRALVKLITECITNDNCPDRHVDMVMKCLWKVIKLMPTWGENVDYESVLLEVHHFLVKFPSKWWTKRPVDTPMRTIKTILHSTVKIKGANSMQLLRKIPNPAESEIESYILRVLKISPVIHIKPKPVEPKKAEHEESKVELLSLAPFTSNPKIVFEDVPIGSAHTRRLLVKNPTGSDIHLFVKKSVPEELNLVLSWTEAMINRGTEKILEMVWQPSAKEACRHSFTLSDGKRINRDVAVTFRTLSPKKLKSTGTNKKTNINKSPIKLPLTRKTASPTKHLKAQRKSPRKYLSPKRKSPVKKPASPQKLANQHRYLSENLTQEQTYVYHHHHQMGAWSHEMQHFQENKENVSPAFQRNASGYFMSPTNATFSMENNDTRNTYVLEPLAERRETFTLRVANYCDQNNSVISKSKYFESTESTFTMGSLENSPNSRDSLEPPDRVSTPLLAQNNQHQGGDGTPTLESLLNRRDFTEKFKSSPDFGDKLKSLENFTFSPAVSSRGLFPPSVTNNREVFSPAISNLGAFSPAVFSTNIKNLRNTFSYTDGAPRLATNLFSPNAQLNLSSESNEANISSNTYTKENLSWNNASSETYVKNASFEDVEQLKVPFPVLQKTSDLCFGNTESFKNPADFRWQQQNLSSIAEESGVFSECSLRNGVKRKSLSFSSYPTKREKISPERKKDWSKKGGTAFRIAKSTTGLSLEKLQKSSPKNTLQPISAIKETTVKSVIIQNPFLYSNLIDPFMGCQVYSNDEWLDAQEQRFKKWINMLLTPPDELNSKNEVDIAKIWQQCKKKEVPEAPTKEVLSLNFHTSSKLDALRREAQNLFRSKEMSSVLQKVCIAVETGKLSIREDKDIYLNLKLKSDLMTLLFSYNPLWLRIGLETIYNEIIPLKSNSDTHGLANFLLERFFKDPYLVKKHKTLYSPKYSSELKKFLLKKFLILVYFLDKAKNVKLIAHDPCLFCNNSAQKESKLMLISFARDTLAAIGDVTKYLKCLGYVVTHVQSYIHEFNYAVKNLGVDLRDGVRLTKIMEIIQMRNDLIDKLRVPAISRLQKVHNMQIVFRSLAESGYEIQYDICAKDIVDGHREKTLSFLWQIIYKFDAPLMVTSASTVQRWFRSLPVMLKRRQLQKLYQKRENAARKIQGWYRRQKLAKLYASHADILHNLRFVELKKATQLVQAKYRANNAMKLQRFYYLKQRNAAVKIQQWYRATIKMRQCRIYYQKLKVAVCRVEMRFKAQIEMRLQRSYYINVRRSCLLVQKKYKSILTTRKCRKKFVELRAAVITIQRRFRAIRDGRIIRKEYEQLRSATIMMQRRYRAQQAMQQAKATWTAIKTATVCIQSRYRAAKVRDHYKRVKNAVLVIQRRYRAQKLMIVERKSFEKYCQTVIFVQQKFRAKLLAKQRRSEYVILKTSVITIQQRFKANLLMKKQKEEFTKLRQATITIQRKYRAMILMRTARKEFIALRSASIVIQQRYKAIVAMWEQSSYYRVLKMHVKVIQTRFRANRLAKIDRANYLKLRGAAITIQRRFRARHSMVLQMERYSRFKWAALVLQRRYRAQLAMKREMSKFRSLKHATFVIQRRFRASVLSVIMRKWFLKLKNSVRIIQTHFRAYLSMKKERGRFLEVYKATVVLQRFGRGYLARKKYLPLLTPEAVETRRVLRVQNAAAVVIQASWRGHRVRKTNIDVQEAIKKRRKERGNESVNPIHGTTTLAQRCEMAMLCMTSENSSLLMVIRALKDLDFITRHCRDSCIRLSHILPSLLYTFISSAARSLPEMDACNTAAFILINFCKYPRTRANSWDAAYVDAVVNVMLHWCDKEAPLFATLCTLLWLFGHEDQWKQVILGLPNINQRFHKIQSLVLRKQNMVLKSKKEISSSVFGRVVTRKWPTRHANWGLDYDRPNTFTNAAFGFSSLMNILEIV